MEALFSFFVFIFGLFVGSFLNCVIYRLEKEESFLRGRSSCPNCKHNLAWYDLIPVFSFLILKGKCRYCHKRISFQYPLVELANGFLFFLVFQFLFLNNNSDFGIRILDFVFYLFISSILLVIFVYDFKYYLVPSKITIPAILLSFFYRLFEFLKFHQFSFVEIILAIVPALFFLLIAIISQEKWMGKGDFEVAMLMGFVLLWPKILLAIFLSFFFGAIIGLGLIVVKKKEWKSEIPFAPFLVFSTFLILFLGEKLIYYLSFIL